MSTGNDNFITVDSIAEIQDITDGDFLFSISNGVIYKLDFSNFIITLDNTDFGTNYRALSTQVTINTAVLSSLGFLSDEQFTIIDKLIDAYEIVEALSAEWTAAYNSVRNLSSTRWLPVPTPDEPFRSGAMCYWDGAAQDWVPLNTGLPGDNLITNANGLPSFGGDLTSFRVISEGKIRLDNQATIGRAYNNETYSKTVNLGDTITDSYDYVQVSTGVVFDVQLNPAINQNPVKVVKKKKKKKWYKKVFDVVADVANIATLGIVDGFTGGALTAISSDEVKIDVVANKSLSPSFVGSSIQLYESGRAIPTGNGTGIIGEGNAGSQLPINLQAQVDGTLNWNDKLNYFTLELVYRIVGDPTQRDA